MAVSQMKSNASVIGALGTIGSGLATMWNKDSNTPQVQNQEESKIPNTYRGIIS
jgi:hypothetical protein